MLKYVNGENPATAASHSTETALNEKSEKQ